MTEDGCYCSTCRMPPCDWCTRDIAQEEADADLEADISEGDREAFAEYLRDEYE